jgi:hypothetical protein
LRLLDVLVPDGIGADRIAGHPGLDLEVPGLQVRKVVAAVIVGFDGRCTSS